MITSSEYSRICEVRVVVYLKVYWDWGKPW